MDTFTVDMFNQVWKLLKKIMPILAELDYTKFGSIKMRDEKGQRIYQGLALRLYPGVKSDNFVRVVGQISDRQKQLEMLEANLDKLLSGPVYTSLEVREPPRISGGAIKVSGAFDCWGVEGQPEIVKHLLMAHTLRIFGHISQDSWRSWIQVDNRHLISARAEVGMPENMYIILNRLIFKTVQEAHTKLFSKSR